jgi:hypothetical protein
MASSAACRVSPVSHSAYAADDELFSPLASEKQPLYSLLAIEFFDFGRAKDRTTVSDENLQN